MNNELATIFDECVPCTAVVSHDDSMSYLQKQSKQRLSKKPLPPSQQAIKMYLNHEPKSLDYVLKTFVGRSVLIGTALYLFGDKKSLVKNSVVASASIEAYLYYWYSIKHK